MELKDLQKLEKIAIDAALEAGKYIMEAFNDEVKVNRKNNGGSLASDVVTAVDIHAQRIILDTLKSSIKTYDLGLLAEESEDDGSRLMKDYFWTIDPLDGTLTFTEKKHGFSVSIGLVSKMGEAIIGVVYDPYKDDLYHAIKDAKAYKNGKELQVQFNDEKGLTYYTDRSFTQSGSYSYFIEALNNKSIAEYGQEMEIVSHQGAVLNGVSIIENAPASYIKLPKEKQGGGSLWDFAASKCIAEACGIKVVDYFGNQLNLNKEESTYMNYEGVRYENY